MGARLSSSRPLRPVATPISQESSSISRAPMVAQGKSSSTNKAPSPRTTPACAVKNVERAGASEGVAAAIVAGD